MILMFVLEAPESICHALLDCGDSRDMWLTSAFYSLINDASRTSFDSLFLWLHAQLSMDDMSLLCSSLWACWLGCNKCVMENTSCNLIQLSSAMNKIVMDYKIYA